MATVELGIVTTLASSTTAVSMARMVDDLGFDRFAVSDTQPLLYHAAYPAVTAALLQTKHIKIGPNVTNPVTRHWSIHGATARAFEELAPGRFFLGFGTGDGAVHSVGLKPAKLSEFSDAVIQLRRVMPKTTPIHMAFSGPKGMAVAGQLADEVTIGVGMDAGALRELAGLARAARKKAGIAAPLKIWTGAPVYFAESAADVPAMRALAGGMVALAARFAFSVSFENKNVPPQFQPVLKQFLDNYAFAHHAKAEGNPNAKLFDERPDVRDYLIDRFAVVGTPEQCAERLANLVRDAELDGLWIMPGAPTSDTAEMKRRLELVAKHFARVRTRPVLA